MFNKIKTYFTQVCNEMICLDETPEPASKTTIGLDFWVKSIISYSKETYESFEKSLWYVLYFSNTAFNVPIYNVHWSTDALGNIIITIFWLLAFLFNLIGSLVPYILMMFANFATSGYIQKIVLGMGKWANETIFGWSGNGGNTFGIALIVVCSVLAVALVVMRNYKELTPKKVIKMITQIILTAIIVGFLAPRAIDVGETIDTKTLSFLNLAQINEKQQDMPFNVKVKNELYELLILQPYLIQNFDVGSIEELQKEIDALDMNVDATELVEGVIKCSNDGKQEKCLEKLYPGIKDNGLFSVIHSEYFSTQIGSLPKSLLLMIHKIILSIPFFFIFFAYSIVDFIKWMSLIFATFFLVGMLFKESPNYFSYFINRIKWAFISWGFSLGLTISTALIMNMVTTIISMTSVFTILIFDILLAGIFLFIWMNRKRLSRMLFRLIGFGMMFAGRSAMVGSYSPSNGSDDLKAEFKNMNANFQQMIATIQNNISTVDNQEQTVNESNGGTGDDSGDTQSSAPLHNTNEVDGDIATNDDSLKETSEDGETESSADKLEQDPSEENKTGSESQTDENIDNSEIPGADEIKDIADEISHENEQKTVESNELDGDIPPETITDQSNNIDNENIADNPEVIEPSEQQEITELSDTYTDEDAPPKTSYDKYKNFSATINDDIPIRKRKKNGEQDEEND